MSVVVDAKKMFINIKIHNQFEPSNRKSDLNGRLTVVAEHESTPDFEKKHLQNYIRKELNNNAIRRDKE